MTLFNKSYYDVSLCQGAVGSGGGSGGDNENQDILSKIKIAMTKNIDFDTLGTNIGNKLNQVIATGVPTEISYGFVCGFSSGLALKKFGKVASIVLGLGFAALQTLSYAGYIQIDHVQLQKDVERAMDLNKDGKVDAKDMEQMVDKVLEVLQFGIPGGAGFVTGFIGGFRSG
eukprot:CAMPEP_0176491686 /NCGR_PEP_ID=MMETSP0200_2-20121128/8566_1 /TAXON_ID=947934 /ORGANISM="Chaetoceros sp., Strain GSL56" /LENGTH=171 /DNA_ID=CAMNT_0017889135 /DNA_START=104 /DNA_END=619 /DNA_ORIENTATION=+